MPRKPQGEQVNNVVTSQQARWVEKPSEREIRETQGSLEPAEGLVQEVADVFFTERLCRVNDPAHTTMYIKNESIDT